MPFIGAVPAQKYISLAKQDFTTIAGTGYTLDQSVTNEVDIALFINHVRQEPTTAYTASGTTLTLTSATTTSDDMYCVFLGKATESINPPSGSVNTSQLVDGAVNNSKIASDAAIATTKLGAGAVLQVVTATDSTERSTSSSSFVTASNTLAVDITPSSTSSKIYVNCNFHFMTPTNTNQLRCTIFRDSTNLGDSDQGFGQLKAQADGTGNYFSLGSMAILDSPSTTSEVTYQLYMKTTAGTGKINANTALSTITAFEISG